MVMKENGPLVHFWGMPLERRHVLLKGVSDITNCYRNFPISMGIRNQLQLAYSKESYYGPGSSIAFGPVKDANVKELVITYKQDIKGKKFTIIL